jgi:TRAP-type mannitol/chloroaromatic compound transport system permease large subunit
VLVVLGDQLNNSYQAAQLASGIFAPSSLSVGDLFAGAIVPALTLVALYIVYLIVVAFVRPQAAPPIPAEPGAPRGWKLARRVAEAMVAPVLLIVAVLGSILAGLATPTESAAVGAFGALALTARKIEARAWPVTLGLAAIVAALVLHGFVDVRLNRAAAGLGEQIALAVALALVAIIAIATAVAVRIVWRHGILAQVTARTTQITAMIFLILIGATLFSLVFRGLGGDEMVHRALADLPGGTGGAVLAVMVAMFLLGFVMDVFEIVFVVVPIVAPVLLRMEGVDPVWLGVMMAVNLQTSFMHPPLGPTLFYLRSVAPPGLTTRHIYVGIIPYVAIQLACLVVLWFLPGLATALPNALYRR